MGLAAVFVVLALTAAGYQALDLIPDPLVPRLADPQGSTRIEDRQGRLMYEFAAGSDDRRRWTPLSDFGPLIPAAALAAEDSRFLHHPGVDPLAVVRAVGQNLGAGRIKSGASTITMQLARALRPGPRTWRSKLRETVLALRIE